MRGGNKGDSKILAEAIGRVGLPLTEMGKPISLKGMEFQMLLGYIGFEVFFKDTK